MNGGQFIRAVRKYAKAQGMTVVVDAERGKGGHQTLYLSNGRHTVVKTGEIKTGLLMAMLKQLGLPKDAI